MYVECLCSVSLTSPQKYFLYIVDNTPSIWQQQIRILGAFCHHVALLA